MFLRRLFAALLATALLLPLHLARAGLFPGDVVDGPSADIEAVGGLKLAQDGSGGLVYTKAGHVFVSRFISGRWNPPELIDGSLPPGSSQPRIAAGQNGRLAIIFSNGGALFGVLKPNGSANYSAPVTLATGGASGDPSLDMNVNGTAYAAFTVGNAVRTARVNGNDWSVIPGVLNIDANQQAGSGNLRPRVATAADGRALVVWGETGSGGRSHVFARKVLKTTLSANPIEVSVDAVGSQTGGAADSPAVATEYDGDQAFVAWRQEFDGVPRVLVRHLRGLSFDPPAALDGMAFPGSEGAGEPGIAIDGGGRGFGLAARRDSFVGLVSLLSKDQFAPATAVAAAPNTRSPLLTGAVGLDKGDEGLVAWQQSGNEIHARALADGLLQPEGVLSRPEFGGIMLSGGLVAGSDRIGDVAVAFVQGGGDQRRLVVAGSQLPPGPFFSTNAPQMTPGSLITWTPARELWGPVVYTVLLNGRLIGTTSATSLKPSVPLPIGHATLIIQARDIHGQVVQSKPKGVVVRESNIKLLVEVHGSLAAGQPIEIQVHGRKLEKRGGKGKKSAHAAANKKADAKTKEVPLDDITIDFGDQTPLAHARRVVHRYKHSGTYKLIVFAVDKSGGEHLFKRHLRIR